MARPVTVTLSHDLGKEEARRRITSGFDRLSSGLGLGRAIAFNQVWTNEDQLQFEAAGLAKGVKGRIDIFPNHVRIEAVLPDVLAAIADIVTGKLEREGQLLLEKK